MGCCVKPACPSSSPLTASSWTLVCGSVQNLTCSLLLRLSFYPCAWFLARVLLNNQYACQDSFLQVQRPTIDCPNQWCSSSYNPDSATPIWEAHFWRYLRHPVCPIVPTAICGGLPCTSPEDITSPGGLSSGLYSATSPQLYKVASQMVHPYLHILELMS